MIGLIIAVVAVFAILFIGPLYVVNEGEQAVVVEMGKITQTTTKAGLHWKVPFIDEVVRYPKKVMSWDGEQKSMPTREKQYIWVDMTARWEIADPKKFYESVGTIDGAYKKLGEIIDSEVRTVVSQNYLRESVRNSNIIMESTTSLEDSLGISDTADTGFLNATIQPGAQYDAITKGRRKLAEEILARSSQMMPQYGIRLIDVVTRQIRYTDELTQSVYARMTKERSQIAQAFRSEGEGRKAEWEGKTENEKRSIMSEAYEKSETIRGTADAEAAKIYADAYSKDPDFFDFWRATESYRTTMPNFDKTLSTDMDYFKYLYKAGK
jgi:membrane protease subunit HflC